jgi:hypothetical protein
MKREATIEGWALEFNETGKASSDFLWPISIELDRDGDLSVEVNITSSAFIPLAVLEQLIAWHKDPPK